MKSSYIDTSGNMQSAAAGSLGLFPTKGDDVVKQLEASLATQRKKRKLGDPPTDRSMQLMPPATRDLLGNSNQYGLG